jgi:class 3 adenylate cyclase
MADERGPSPNGGLRAAHERLHRLAYDRLGIGYPRLVAVGDAVGLLHLVTLVATGTWPLYIDMPSAVAIRVVVVVQLLFAGVSVVAWRLGLRLVQPIEDWIGARDEQGRAAAAWKAGVEFPFAFLRAPSILLAALLASVGATIYAGFELDLPWYEALVLLAGLGVALAAFALMSFLSFEHGLRPVLEDIARALPASPPPGPRFSLHRRLALALPVITIVTGIVVAGVLPGSGGVGNLAIAIAAALAVSLLVSIWLIALLADSVLTPIAALRQAAKRVEKGDLSVRVTPAGADEIGDFARVFNETVGGLEERERLREALGAYVDPELAERVRSKGVDLSGEEVEVSIVFVDLRGFTPLAERTGARQIVALLNDFYDCVIPIVREHGGHPNKLVGDGLLTVFGAPDRRPDHGAQALGAALAIATAVRLRYRGELRVGVGVDSGTVVVGTIGGGGRLDFTVIGDTVNTAVRVETATRQTDDDVLATEATLRLAGIPTGSWQERHAVTLKGKQQRVRVFAPPLAPEQLARPDAEAQLPT